MPIIYPEATPVQGNTKVLATPSVAVLATPDLSSEIGHASAVDLSCFIRDWNPEIQTNTGSAPSRLCTTVQLPVEGNTQFNPIEIRYVYDPQAGATDDNKALDLLVRGTELFLIVRKGLDARDTDFAAAQKVETWKFRCGRQNRLRSGEDEFSEYEIVQMMYPLTEPTYGAVVA